MIVFRKSEGDVSKNMGMEHKSFLFDTDKFKKELMLTIIKSVEVNSSEMLLTFINTNLSEIQSPYTGDSLTDGWEEEINNGDIQELSDFALTKYYSPDEELGLAYDWDALLEAIDGLPLKLQRDYYILGQPLETESFVLDPGAMGMGFVFAEDIPGMYQELVSLREYFVKNCLTLSEDVLYELSESELISAYDTLTELMKYAKDKECGLLMTF